MKRIVTNQDPESLFDTLGYYTFVSESINWKAYISNKFTTGSAEMIWKAISFNVFGLNLC